MASWLEDRTCTVLVSGLKTSESALSNSVFQGTVLGPPLWNLFYADASPSVRCLGFTDVVFADDFNCWKAFAAGTTCQEISRQTRRCQGNLHEWGAANSVKFDAGKESFHVLHRTRNHGDGFRLLGLSFDESLRMGKACSEIAREAVWRLQSVLRPRRVFTQRQVINLYKSQVLSFVESGTPGYYHASQSVLAPIDRVQKRLLREMALSEVPALEMYSLVPLPSRRDMAMLGFLQRVALGHTSAQIRDLFPLAALPLSRRIPTIR